MEWMLEFCDGSATFQRGFSINFCKGTLPIILFIIWQTCLQGLDPNLRFGEAALALYEKEVGPQPKKVRHLEFFRARVLRKIWNRIK